MPEPRWVEDVPRWVEDTPPRSSSHQRRPPPPQSGIDWWVEQVLRTTPAVVGGLAGGLAGIPALGLGAVGGGMAGGSAGAAVGNLLGNWYSGKEFNPAEFGVETVLGGAPPILGPAKFVGKGAGAIGKYMLNTGLRSGLEGAVVSGAGTPFQHWAQTGSLDAPASEYMANLGGGAVTGFGLGAGIGGFHGRALNNAPPPVVPPVVPPVPVGAGQTPGALAAIANVPPPPPAPNVPPGTPYPPNWLPFEGSMPPQGGENLLAGIPPPSVSEPSIDFGMDVNQPTQMDLNLGPYRSAAGRFATGQGGPGIPPKYGPLFQEPMQQNFLVDDQHITDFPEDAPLTAPFASDRPPAAALEGIPPPAGVLPPEVPPVAPPPAPAPAPTSGLPQYVVYSNATDFEIQKQQGYVPSGQTVKTPEGNKPVLVLKGGQPNAMPADVPPPTAPSGAPPSQLGGVTRFNADNGLTLKRADLERNPAKIRALKKQGFVVISKDEVNGTITFGPDPANEPAFARDTGGEDGENVDPFSEGRYTRAPTESTGNVAPFTPPQRAGMDHYELPDGSVIPTDATATKGAPTIDYQLKGGEMVQARLVKRATLDKYGEPVGPDYRPPPATPAPPQGDPPPQLDGIFDQAVETMQQVNDTDELVGYAQIIAKGINYHRKSGNTTELELYTRMFQELENHIQQVRSAPKKPGEPGWFAEEHARRQSGQDAQYPNMPELNGPLGSVAPKLGPRSTSAWDAAIPQEGQLELPWSRGANEETPGTLDLGPSPKMGDFEAPSYVRNTEDGVAEVDAIVKQDLDIATKRAIKKDLQDAYDSSVPATQSDGTPNDFVLHDSGDRYTPEEIQGLNDNPIIIKFNKVFKGVLDKLDTLFPTEQIGRTSKHGILLHDTDIAGINLPNQGSPKGAREHAVMINIFNALAKAKNPRQAAQLLVHAMMHEFTHNIIRVEGDKFTYKLMEVHGKLDLEDQLNARNAIIAAISGRDGQYSPELQKLLQQHLEVRGRGDTTVDLIKRAQSRLDPTAEGPEGVSYSRGNTGGRVLSQQQRAEKLLTAMSKEEKKPSIISQAYNLARGLTTTLDLSAPLRQGLPLIATKHWWKAWIPMVKALGSEKAFQKSLSDIKAREIFQSGWDDATNKFIPSDAHKAGMKLSDISSVPTRREEAAASQWAETGDFLKAIPGAQALYKGTLGRGVRASNRAYTAFLNQLRADTFESLMKDAQRMAAGAIETGYARPGLMKQKFSPVEAMELDPFHNKDLAKKIADFVNTATGRGPLKIALPGTNESGSFGLKEYSLEKNAELLTNTLFSPRLFASRMRMLNPATYMMAPPMVRKQYMKAALSTAAAWGTVSMLAKAGGAEVSGDTNSADFGKIKFGNTRLDPAGGFQQYLVAFSRLLSGHTTSSGSSEADFELGQGYRAETRGTVAQRFITNKLHPIAKFANDLAFASKYQPFHVKDRTMQLFVPLVIGDMTEMINEDPSLLPLMAPVVAGMGTQTYEKGESQGRFIAPENDWLFKGGELW